MKLKEVVLYLLYDSRSVQTYHYTDHYGEFDVIYSIMQNNFYFSFKDLCIKLEKCICMSFFLFLK